MVEERKGNEKDRKIEAAIHDEDNMINLRVQYLDQRRPKQQNDANLRQRNEKRQQLLYSLNSQMEARERLLKHQHNEMKQKAIRPASNQIDRFGRIAFNKNRELSQASLDVESNFSGNSQGRGESLENRRLIHTEQENVLFSLKKRREKVKAQIDNMQA